MVFFTPDNNTGVYRCAKSNTGGYRCLQKTPGTGVCKKTPWDQNTINTTYWCLPQYILPKHHQTLYRCSPGKLSNRINIPPRCLQKTPGTGVCKKTPLDQIYWGQHHVLVFTPVYFTKTPSNTVPVFTW